MISYIYGTFSTYVCLYVDQKNVQGLYDVLNRLISNNRPSAEHFPLYSNIFFPSTFSFDLFDKYPSWNFIHLEQAGSPCFPSQHKAQILPQGKKKALCLKRSNDQLKLCKNTKQQSSTSSFLSCKEIRQNRSLKFTFIVSKFKREKQRKQ